MYSGVRTNLFEADGDPGVMPNRPPVPAVEVVVTVAGSAAVLVGDISRSSGGCCCCCCC